jgi:GNAT superfamily N-acetyltransferase
LGVRIEIVDRDSDPRVYTFRDHVADLSLAILFVGDRWRFVERVALAIADDGQIVGMGTLAPKDEGGGDTPTIIGVWVEPHFRRNGTAVALLKALAVESVRLYGRPPEAVAVTPAGASTCRRAQADGAQLIVMVVNTGFDLP